MASRTRLEVLAYVFPHLVMPVGPVVAAFRAPVVQMMSNSAAREHLGHSIGGAAVLPTTTTGHEPDVAAPILFEKPGFSPLNPQTAALTSWSYFAKCGIHRGGRGG